MPDPDAARQAAWRATTLRKLGEVSDRIATLKSGEDRTLADMVVPGEPDAGESKLDRLERFKALLNDTLRALTDGTHGLCAACGQRVRDVELDEMPWATVCGTCAAAGATEE